VAEGVETSSAVASRQRMGWTAAQGFFYCRPIPGPDVWRWVRHHDESLGVSTGEWVAGTDGVAQIAAADGSIGP
jgi:predicted signal transduction protein with EAL and GGDEF domain